MIGKKFLKMCLAVVFIILVGFTANSYAGVSDGHLCFKDGFNALWVLDYVSFGNESFQLTGFRQGASCNGTTAQPLTGTGAVISGNNVVLGAMTLTNEVNVCSSTSWNIIMSLDTLSGSNGAWTNGFGSQGNFTLHLVTCPSVIALKEMDAGIIYDPAMILK